MRNKVSFSIPTNRASSKISPTPCPSSPDGSVHLDHSASDGTMSSSMSATTSRNNVDQKRAQGNLPDVVSPSRENKPPTLPIPGITRQSIHSFSDHVAQDFLKFSKDNNATHRTRVFRLLVIFAVPMIVVFVECGLIISKAVWSQHLVAGTNSGIMAALEIGSLVTNLQKEREISSICLTSLSDSSPCERVGAFRNSTDKALGKLTKWLGTKEDGTNFVFAEDFRKHLADHRETINSSSDSLSVLRWYTSTTTHLIRWVNRGVFMAGDNGGDLWKYFVAYELLLHSKDAVGLQRALGGHYHARGYHTLEERQWFEEAEEEARVLLDVVFIHSPRTKELYQFLLDKHNQPVHLLKSITRKVLSLDHASVAEQTGNVTKMADQENAQRWFANMTVVIDDIIGPSIFDLMNYIMAHLDIQAASARHDFNVAISILVSIIVVCPCLCIWYVYSVSKMAQLIGNYAEHVSQQTTELNFEKKRTERLLYQMLPPSVADALKRNRQVEAEYYDSVTIFFSDVVDFSKLSAACSSTQVIEFLNSLYTGFDSIIDRFDVYKVETMGDAYMVASGLPVRNGNRHSGQIAKLSLSLLELAQSFVIPHLPHKKLLLRIGIHTGSCVAGVIGLKMPRYCLFGDTVNTASRMESHGAPLRIHLSDSTRIALDVLGGFEFVCRGLIEVKGKGKMMTWWLIGSLDVGFTVNLLQAEREAELALQDWES